MSQSSAQLPQHFEPDEKIYFDPMEYPIHPEWMDASDVTAWIEDCRRVTGPNESPSTTKGNNEASSVGWNSWQGNLFKERARLDQPVLSYGLLKPGMEELSGLMTSAMQGLL